MRTALLLAVLTISSASAAAAQDFGGYVTAGSGSIDYRVHRETILQATGGVLCHAANGRIRVGGEVDAMTSNGYVAGRGGPLAEVVLFKGRIEPFVRGGYFVGEDSSWIAGGGVDFWLTPRAGLRVIVQDALRANSVTYSFGERSTVLHEPSFQIGWMWK